MRSTVYLIAKREVDTRLQQRGFRIGLIVTLVIVALAAAVPSLFGGDDGPKTYDVAVVGTAPDALTTALKQSAAARGARVEVRTADSADRARADVRSGDVDAALSDGRLIVQKSDDAVTTIVQDAYQSASVVERLTRAGLSASQAQQALEVQRLDVSTTTSGESVQRQVLASILVVFLFGQLILYVTWMGMGVVEEKTSRVVELLLATVRPRQMLTGKLLGIGLLATAQAVLIGAVALVVAVTTGTLQLPGSAYATIASGVLWFVLGFGFFAALAAAMASLVSRQEEVSSVLTPVTSILLVTYIGGFAVASNPDSGLARLLSIVPPFSVISMPARMARGGTPWTDVVAAVVLMVIVTAVVLAAASRIYRAAVLHTGGRLSLRTAWRSEPAAELA